ncbi:MAG: glycosyltransferase family 2 protein [Christensenellales bacterium]|jgi:glycosyltransferase involved in cell wall biosynthesis
MEVSVIIPTFNQAKFLKQCLDSVFSQKVNFDYEVLVGDDCSTDNTLEILKEYQEKYDNLRVFSMEKNIGATNNVYFLCCNMTGKYFAYLEGDDYWCDNTKLQRQYDFLEKNKNYAACFHNIALVDINGRRIKSKIAWISKKKTMSLKSFDGYKLPGHSLSWMRRNYYLENKEDFNVIWELDNNIGDRVAAMCFLAKGDFYNIGGIMGCYRYMRKTSISNITSDVYAKKNRALEDIEILNGMEKYLQEVVGITKNFNVRKREIFCEALFRYVRYPKLENEIVVKKIYKKSEQKFLLILRVPFALLKKMLQKLFYKA